MKITTILLLTSSLLLPAATVIGPGTSIGATIADNPGGDRLNVHQVAETFSAGTYTVSDWSLDVLNHDAGLSNAGTVTPMLLIGSPSSYTTLWIGSAFDPTANGAQTITESGSFTLEAETAVYAGFFTQSEGSDIIGLVTSGGPTSHDSTFTAPTGVDQAVDSFSNATLNRQYAFSITVVPEPSAAVLLPLSGVTLLRRRRR